MCLQNLKQVCYTSSKGKEGFGVRINFKGHISKEPWEESPIEAGTQNWGVCGQTHGRATGWGWDTRLQQQWHSQGKKNPCVWGLLLTMLRFLAWCHHDLDALIPIQFHSTPSVFKTLNSFAQLKFRLIGSNLFLKFWSNELPRLIQLELIHILTSIFYLKIQAKYTINAPFPSVISLN